MSTAIGIGLAAYPLANHAFMRVWGEMMSESWTPSRVRIAVARLCDQRGIDLAELYRALGTDAVAAESDAVAHLAGVIDGLEAAANGDDGFPPRAS